MFIFALRYRKVIIIKQKVSKEKKIMCGIACIFNIKQQNESLRRKALEMSKKIRHRGPD